MRLRPCTRKYMRGCFPRKRQVGNRRDNRTRKRRCANSLLRENDGARWWLNNATVMPPLDFLLNWPTVPEKRITAISRLSQAPSKHRKRYHRSQTPLNYSIKNTLNSLFSRGNAGIAIQILFEKQVFFLTGNELRWISIITIIIIFILSANNLYNKLYNI